MESPGQLKTSVCHPILLSRFANEAFLNAAFRNYHYTKSEFCCTLLTLRSTKEAFLNTAFGNFMSTKYFVLLPHFLQNESFICCGYFLVVESEKWNFSPKILFEMNQEKMFDFFHFCWRGNHKFNTGFWLFKFQNLFSFFLCFVSKDRINNNRKILQTLEIYLSKNASKNLRLQFEM